METKNWLAEKYDAQSELNVESIVYAAMQHVYSKDKKVAVFLVQQTTTIRLAGHDPDKTYILRAWREDGQLPNDNFGHFFDCACNEVYNVGLMVIYGWEHLCDSDKKLLLSIIRDGEDNGFKIPILMV